MTSGALVVENAIWLAPVTVAIVLVASVLLKKLLDGKGLLKRKSEKFLRD